jgi:hypothetical protein
MTAGEACRLSSFRQGGPRPYLDEGDVHSPDVRHAAACVIGFFRTFARER